MGTGPIREACEDHARNNLLEICRKCGVKALPGATWDAADGRLHCFVRKSNGLEVFLEIPGICWDDWACSLVRGYVNGSSWMLQYFIEMLQEIEEVDPGITRTPSYTRTTPKFRNTNRK
jgi:hypothetical protein